MYFFNHLVCYEVGPCGDALIVNWSLVNVMFLSNILFSVLGFFSCFNHG